MQKQRIDFEESNNFNEIFDCDKLKSLLQQKKPLSLGEKINNWINNYVAGARIKIAEDIKLYASKNNNQV